MIKRPAVLNGQQTSEWLRKKCGGNLFSTTVPNVQEEREAQRDADVAYYEPFIRTDAISYTQGVLDGGEKAAREIFGEIEKLNKHHRFGFEDGTLLIYAEDWQALKDEHLKNKSLKGEK